MKQECIPVGCVPPARLPYAGVCFGEGGVLSHRGVYLVPGGMSALGGAPGPGGMSAPRGGGVPGPRGCTFSRGWVGGLPGPGGGRVYLVRYSPPRGQNDTRF